MLTICYVKFGHVIVSEIMLEYSGTELLSMINTKQDDLTLIGAYIMLSNHDESKKGVLLNTNIVNTISSTEMW